MRPSIWGPFLQKNRERERRGRASRAQQRHTLLMQLLDGRERETLRRLDGLMDIIDRQNEHLAALHLRLLTLEQDFAALNPFHDSNVVPIRKEKT